MTLTPYVFRDLPQENRYWFVGGVYAGKKGVLEWCDSFKDACRIANLMVHASPKTYDIKVVRL
jgi:hypothetical protein